MHLFNIKEEVGNYLMLFHAVVSALVPKWNFNVQREQFSE